MKNTYWLILALASVLALGSAAAFWGGGMMGFGQHAAASGEWQEQHEVLESILEAGSYQDLVDYREEAGYPVLPWVHDEDGFELAKEHHEAMEQMHEQVWSQSATQGRGFGCPMMGGWR